MADAVEDMEVASFKKGNRKRLLLLLWLNSKSTGLFFLREFKYMYNIMKSDNSV